ncbi:MAG: hypothetical protein OEY52_10695 [Gammaproteobacteria bacterium]|nr:hypothetical protein [Gammaproteobacteria bacterium]
MSQVQVKYAGPNRRNHERRSQAVRHQPNRRQENDRRRFGAGNTAQANASMTHGS